MIREEKKKKEEEEMTQFPYLHTNTFHAYN